ncbi:MAG: sigma 54-interacting transcriptional regulator [Desulfobacteraceae bacterium]|jgi:DNA-binding NtrC family response regulator
MIRRQTDEMLATKTKPAAMLWELIRRLANTTLTIRISGETGVGKEAVARLIYRHYPHENAAFVVVDCRKLELASSPSPMAELNGVLTSPEGHVIYLKHLESAPKIIHNHLLELLSTPFASAPPWIIASSLQPLERFIHNGHFSIPLFRALDTIQIYLPPLRSRPEKTPQILSWLLSQYNAGDFSMPDHDAMERFIEYHWPGNWRQIQEVARKASARKKWDIPFTDSQSDADKRDKIDEIAAIYILSMAELSIHKDKVMENLMAACNLEEIGLLDLAIFNEAVSQIADHLSAQHAEQNRY